MLAEFAPKGDSSPLNLAFGLTYTFELDLKNLALTVQMFLSECSFSPSKTCGGLLPNSPFSAGHSIDLFRVIP
jgi:hypothetical protein